LAIQIDQIDEFNLISVGGFLAFLIVNRLRFSGRWPSSQPGRKLIKRLAVNLLCR